MGALEPAALLRSPRPDFTDPADLERYLSTVRKEDLPAVLASLSAQADQAALAHSRRPEIPRYPNSVLPPASGFRAGVAGCLDQALEVLAERPVLLDRPDDPGQPVQQRPAPAGGRPPRQGRRPVPGHQLARRHRAGVPQRLAQLPGGLPG